MDARKFTVTSTMGKRVWTADDEEHAREQHTESFPEEPILAVEEKRE